MATFPDTCLYNSHPGCGPSFPTPGRGSWGAVGVLRGWGKGRPPGQLRAQGAETMRSHIPSRGRPRRIPEHLIPVRNFPRKSEKRCDGAEKGSPMGNEGETGPPHEGLGLPAFRGACHLPERGCKAPWPFF